MAAVSSAVLAQVLAQVVVQDPKIEKRIFGMPEDCDLCLFGNTGVCHAEDDMRRRHAEWAARLTGG